VFIAYEVGPDTVGAEAATTESGLLGLSAATSFAIAAAAIGVVAVLVVVLVCIVRQKKGGGENASTLNTPRG
jgi:hypothetical protein